MDELNLDDYLIGETLGVGTVGKVMQATHKETGKQYALKWLHPSVSQQPLIVSRFEREMEVLEKLNHPHIIRYHGGGRRAEQLYFLMELVEGGTIRELVDAGGRFTWQETAECGRQIASALQHAHNHGIIHRDLKPSNVFLTSDGKCKLGDFGIARDLHAGNLTDAGLTVGTYAYMPPELVKGERAITGLVDLYSLGCMLFELLTGRTPYVGDNFAQIFEQHLKSKPPSPSEFGAQCPRGMENLIDQLLAKDPEQRPFNARTVQGVLGEICAEAGVSSREELDDEQGADKAARSVRVIQDSLKRRIAEKGSNPHDISTKKLVAVISVVLAVIVIAWLATGPK